MMLVLEGVVVSKHHTSQSSDDSHFRYAAIARPVQIRNAGTIRISIELNIPGM